MKGPIFDTHAHYCSTRFDPDREELLARGGLYYKLYKLQYEHGLEPVEV